MLLDASPLIYLAKIEALDVFAATGFTPLVTPEVERETARPGLAYEYPDAMLIAEALRQGVLHRTTLTDAEERAANRLMAEAGGMAAGEAGVLAAAAGRRLPVLLFERRAMRLARSMGIEAWDPVRLMLHGTADRALLRERLVRFAGLVAMRFEDVEQLLQRVEDEDR